jgi:hypothetical protein
LKRKTTKQLKLEIRDLNKRLTKAYEQRNQLEEECREHRNYWRTKQEWFLKLLSENKGPCLHWLVADMAKYWVRVGGHKNWRPW